MEIQSIIDVLDIYKKTDEELLAWLSGKNLIKQLRCKISTCRRQCVIYKKKFCNSINHTYFCKKCRKTYSIFSKSFFENVNINTRMVILIMWYWATGSRVGVTAAGTNMSKNAVIQLYRYFRDVISWKLMRDGNVMLGGKGNTVQIKEYSITKRKSNSERIDPDHWIIAIYDVSLKKGYIQYVPNRTQEVLEDVIQRHVCPGSEIWTDMFKSYNNLKNLGYVHRSINHSKFFKDPETGVCINKLEGYWSNFKQYLRRLGVLSSPFLSEYIDQFMWDQMYGSNAASRMDNLLMQIAEKY